MSSALTDELVRLRAAGLVSGLDPRPAAAGDLARLTRPEHAELREFWSFWRSARLGAGTVAEVVLLSPADAVAATAVERRWRPDDHRPGDLVIGEFADGRSMLVRSAGDVPEDRVLVTDAVDGREHWWRAANSLVEFLGRYRAARGTRYWEPRVGPLVERLFSEELDSVDAVDVVRQVLRRRLHGEEYLTFDVVNLRLDFDARCATVEDELEPDREERIPLDDLTVLIERAWRRR